VEEGSIAKAIDKLHLTPSALSHQLKEAEHQLGTKIFHRVNKRLLLTEAGQKVYDSAKVILQEINKVNLEVKSLVNGLTGSIRISTECYTSYYWLPSLLKKFYANYPKIEIKIVFEATHNPIEKLLDGQLDLAIVSETLQNETIEYLELFKDEMLAVVPENHPWTEKKYVIAEDFKDVNLIIHSEPLESVTVIQKVLFPAGIEPKNITVLPLTEAAIEMIKAEMGVMVIAKWALKPYLQANTIKTVKVTRNGLKRQQYIARLKNIHYPEYFNLFIKFLKEEIEF
jgi:LysR family transcriptional regulator for metE and metH